MSHWVVCARLWKSIKKILSKITPKGKTKERIKLFYYRLFTSKHINFDLVDAEKKVVYKTTYQNVTLLTNEALYPIVDDFKYYQHFYKVKPNDVIIDAGANCGHLSIYFSNCISLLFNSHIFGAHVVTL